MTEKSKKRAVSTSHDDESADPAVRHHDVFGAAMSVLRESGRAIGKVRYVRNVRVTIHREGGRQQSTDTVAYVAPPRPSGSNNPIRDALERCDRRLVALVLGIDDLADLEALATRLDSGYPDDWSHDDITLVGRCRELLEISTVLGQAGDTPRLITAWWLNRNEHLGGNAPAIVLADDGQRGVERVRAAATHHVAYQ